MRLAFDDESTFVEVGSFDGEAYRKLWILRKKRLPLMAMEHALCEALEYPLVLEALLFKLWDEILAYLA